MSRTAAGTAVPDSPGGAHLPDGHDDVNSTRAASTVRAVVVTTGGNRLPETLAALASQSVANLGITVVDASTDAAAPSEEPSVDVDGVARRFHATVIAARPGSGFAAAANQILSDTSLDAEWILFCHDEIALEPDALENLVDGARTAKAAIAAPKILDWEAPEVLREVGMGADRFGYPYTPVEPGEVDHGQHDGDRIALYATTTCMLVKTDLFRHVGGFDPVLGSIEHDLDFCWRSRLAGATVAIIPSASAYHDPGTIDHGQVRYPRVEAPRHRLRVILKCYSFWALPLLLFQLAVLNLLEAVLLLGAGRGRRARAVGGAWASTFWHIFGILGARRSAQRLRTVRDGEIRALQSTGSARVRAYIENRVRSTGDEDTPVSLQASGTGVSEFIVHELTRPQVIFWGVMLVLLVVGGRKLILGSQVPLVGEAVTIPSTSQLWNDFFGTWHSFGFGTPAPAPPSGFLLGFIQWIFPGRGTAKVILLAYFLGLVGIWRASSRLGKWPGPGIAVVLYALTPIAIGSMMRGNLSAIVFFGFAPYILKKMIDQYVIGRGLIRRTLGLSLILAVCGAFFPAALPISIAMAVLMVVGSIYASRLGASLLALLQTVIASAIAFGLLWPWSASLIRPGSPLTNALGNWVGAKIQVGVAGALRMQVTQSGSSPWGYVFAGLGFAALFIVTRERLGWAARLWPVALGSMAAVWLAGQGLTRPAIPLALGVLVPAALSLSLIAGLAGSEFTTNLPSRGLGLRRVAGVTAAVVAVVMLAVPFWAFLNGRYGMGENEFRRALEPVAATGTSGSFKVLWIGTQQALPGYPLPLPDGGGGAYSLSGPDGSVLGDDSPQTPRQGSEQLGKVLSLIASEGSSRGGRVLSTLGIRYVVLPTKPVEGPVGSPPPPSEIVDGLKRQLDIAEVASVPGVTVLEVAPDAALYDASLVRPSIMSASEGRPPPSGLADRLLSADFATSQPAFKTPTPGATGSLSQKQGGGVILAEEYDDRWGIVSASSGTTLPVSHSEAFGWSNGFTFATDVDATGKLVFDAGDERRNQLLIEGAALVVLLLLRMVARRRGFDEEDEIPERVAAVA